VAVVALALVAGASVTFGQYLKAERARRSAATEAVRAKASLEFLTAVLRSPLE